MGAAVMIVGVGELLWDVFPDGRKVAGGAPFNFAAHCRRLGHPAAILSRVGDDELGRELRAAVRRLGVDDRFLETDPARPTGTVRVELVNGQPAYTITPGVAWDFIAAAGEAVEELALDARAVCFGTLALRAPASRESISRFVAASRCSLLPSVRVCDVNLRNPPPPADVLRRAVLDADWVKLAGEEWPAVAEALGVPPADAPALHRLTAAGRGGVWIVTRGADGCEVFAEGETIRQPGVPAKVVDTVGAGDAFTAAFVCKHLEGLPLAECARFAAGYAARVCEHRGAIPSEP